MKATNFCQLWLTCADEKEASEITRSLLVKRLVVCAKQIPVTSDYWWEGEALRSKSSYAKATEDTLHRPSRRYAKEGKIKHSDEVLLVMESREDLFDKVEKEVAKLHSYDTFVLESIPISKISEKAASWLKKELSHGGE